MAMAEGVNAAGAAPRFPSLATDGTAPVPTVIGPENVLGPLNTSVPVPISFKPNEPEMIPASESVPLLATETVGACRSLRLRLMVWVNAAVLSVRSPARLISALPDSVNGSEAVEAKVMPSNTVLAAKLLLGVEQALPSNTSASPGRSRQIPATQ